MLHKSSKKDKNRKKNRTTSQCSRF